MLHGEATSAFYKLWVSARRWPPTIVAAEAATTLNTALCYHVAFTMPVVQGTTSTRFAISPAPRIEEPPYTADYNIPKRKAKL